MISWSAKAALNTKFIQFAKFIKQKMRLFSFWFPFAEHECWSVSEPYTETNVLLPVMKQTEKWAFTCNLFGLHSLSCLSGKINRWTEDSKQKQTSSKHHRPPPNLMKRCGRSCHLLLVKSFIKASAVGWERQEPALTAESVLLCPVGHDACPGVSVEPFDSSSALSDCFN